MKFWWGEEPNGLNWVRSWTTHPQNFFKKLQEFYEEKSVVVRKNIKKEDSIYFVKFISSFNLFLIVFAPEVIMICRWKFEKFENWDFKSKKLSRNEKDWYSYSQKSWKEVLKPMSITKKKRQMLINMKRSTIRLFLNRKEAVLAPDMSQNLKNWKDHLKAMKWSFRQPKRLKRGIENFILCFCTLCFLSEIKIFS